MQRTLMIQGVSALALAMAETGSGTQGAQAPASNILPKLTVKDIGCNAKAAAALPKMGERVALARFYGVANGVKVKEDKRSGEFHSALKGTFRAKVTQEGVDTHGQTFSSGLLYLPGGIHELIEAPIMAAEAAGETAEVKFMVDIWGVRNGNAAGFSYGATVLGEPAQVDPLAEMEAQILKLDAPKGDDKPAAEGDEKGASEGAAEGDAKDKAPAKSK